MNIRNFKRIERERATIGIMIELYCNDNHGAILCDECSKLRAYAYERLANCPFEENKPICANCTVHCYKSDMRKRVKDIMRYSGPHLLFRHPFLAIMHLLNEKIYKPFSLRKKTV